MTLLQLFLSTVQRWFVFNLQSIMCGLLEGLVQGRPTHGPAEAQIGQVVATFGGSVHFLACSPRTGFWLCLLGPVISLAGLAVTIHPDSDSPGFLHSGPRSSPQWGHVWTLPPGQSVVVRTLKVLVLKKKKKRYILEMIVLSIHCIINRSETSLYDFS